jgi:cell division protein FtsI (penicillin-binding protein 3)
VDGETIVPASATRRVIDVEAATDVTGMLARVAQDGTARAARVPGYQIAAKTGTARKAQESGGYRDADGNFHHVATVAGFFPADAPAYSMIVILDEPQTEIYASRIAAPLFGELAGWTLRHFQVSPSVDVVFEERPAPASPLDAGLLVEAENRRRDERNETDEAAAGAAAGVGQ